MGRRLVLRAFHDDGSLVGSAKSRECQYRLDRPVLGGPFESKRRRRGPGRAQRCARPTSSSYATPIARAALLAALQQHSARPGIRSRLPAWGSENGGQYTHAATWLGFAHAALGDGGNAPSGFSACSIRSCAFARTRTPCAIESSRMHSPAMSTAVPPWVGRGGWTWYTGAAAWMWRLGIEAILGLRKEDGQLRIDPCIPPSWEGFEAWVRLGAQTIHLVFENPDRVATGVAAMTLDGTRLDSNRIVVIRLPRARARFASGWVRLPLETLARLPGSAAPTMRRQGRSGCRRRVCHGRALLGGREAEADLPYALVRRIRDQAAPLGHGGRR